MTIQLEVAGHTMGFGHAYKVNMFLLIERIFRSMWKHWKLRENVQVCSYILLYTTYATFFLYYNPW